MQIIAGLIIPDNTSFKGKFWEKSGDEFFVVAATGAFGFLTALQ